MPSYDYKCDKCEHAFEAFLSYDNREKPCNEPCPECGEKNVQKVIGGFPGLGCDSNVTPDKKTGGQWSQMMNRVKEYLPERNKKVLDRATNASGRRWYG